MEKWPKNLSKYFLIPQRLIISIMVFFGLSIAFMTRTSLSFVITEMVIRRNDTASSEECRIDELESDTVYRTYMLRESNQFDWSESLQGYILSSFYVGYCLNHIPGGLMASRFGAKYILLSALGLNAFMTLITPICVNAGGATALITIRIIVGFAEAAIYPTIAVVLAAWIPMKERSKVGSFILSGSQLGTIVGSILTGYLLRVYDDWSVVYYFLGSFGAAWCCVFFVLCYSDPKSHPFISNREVAYLEREIGQLERTKNLPTTPWKQMLTSAPVWALISAQFGNGFCFFVMLINYPKYMADVLNYEIGDNGLYSSLPYISMWICAQLNGYLMDFLQARKILSVTAVRKISTLMSLIPPGSFLLGASFAGCDRTAVIVLVTVGVGFIGLCYSGIKVNSVDLAPNYAGPLMALTNSFSALAGALAPYMVGLLTPNRLLLEWRTVFWINMGIQVVTTITYGVWGSGLVQPWNALEKDVEGDNKDEKNEKIETVKE